MRLLTSGVCIVFSFLVLSFLGCASQTVEPDSHQAALGIGIVEGTKGFQQIQKELRTANGVVTKVRGQVHEIEGAAYVVHTKNHLEIRLPVDENTRIDRPAHKGDWIDAYMNEAGRAIYIQNVDDQVVLD